MMSTMPLRTPLSLMFSALLLAACASPQGLHTQGQALDSASLQGPTFSDKLSPATWPAHDWWNSLGDPQLDGLIAAALRSNPDLQVADARARQANAAVLAADAQRQPTLDIEAGVTRSRAARVDDPSGQGRRYGTLRSLSLQGGYHFDLWGGDRAAWEAALGRARASEVDRQGARLTLAAEVTRAYNDLGLAYATQDLAEQDLNARAGPQSGRGRTRQRLPVAADPES
jgi:outer membrane protein TolC